MVAGKIALSSMKELTSLALDIKGEERSKEYYLEEIEKFIGGCKYPGGKTFRAWFEGHIECSRCRSEYVFRGFIAKIEGFIAKIEGM